ncbi:MAG: glutamine--fructose-6-phosphate transaminase (isomerizing) [Gammaproteobacteria bacterium]
MCGIVGAVSLRDITPVLVDGLRRLEYRGYDSAGVVILEDNGLLNRVRTPGKVEKLAVKLTEQKLSGSLGIAHTRWATHGKPEERNAHPHICREKVAIVHNGIIENYQALRKQQIELGYEFTSETDTEVIVHQICHNLVGPDSDLLTAVQQCCDILEGAFALGVISTQEPGRMIAARRGSPLVIGVGSNEYFIASDVAALLPVTQTFIFLEEGDVADIRQNELKIFAADGQQVSRPQKVSELRADSVERGEYKHYMLKEIFEQPRAIAETLEGRITNETVLEESFGARATEIFDQIKGVHIIACGTSYHAGLIGRYWLEAIAGIPCSVEVASEFRYRKPVVRNNSLIVTLSQSGETADTLAGLAEAKRLGFGYSLSICNVPESSLVRESDLVLMTRAGPEIGVASTKAFTTQLVALMLLVIVLGRRGSMTQETENHLVRELSHVPRQVEDVLKLDGSIKKISRLFADKMDALFLGRGAQYPVAMEGALKLKEISYIHAEAYPAGELKHGPLALIDDTIPVIVVAPNNELLEKLKSNIQEVSARGGQMLVFADIDSGVEQTENVQLIPVAATLDIVAPIIFTVPLQLLSYHVAVLKGTDIDQPRNLAKSVTVE